MLCPQCRYLLRGVAEARCPECGTAYAREQLLVEQYLLRDGWGFRPRLTRWAVALVLAGPAWVGLLLATVLVLRWVGPGSAVGCDELQLIGQWLLGVGWLSVSALSAGILLFVYIWVRHLPKAMGVARALR